MPRDFFLFNILLEVNFRSAGTVFLKISILECNVIISTEHKVEL